MRCWWFLGYFGGVVLNFGICVVYLRFLDFVLVFLLLMVWIICCVCFIVDWLFGLPVYCLTFCLLIVGLIA